MRSHIYYLPLPIGKTQPSITVTVLRNNQLIARFYDPVIGRSEYSTPITNGYLENRIDAYELMTRIIIRGMYGSINGRIKLGVCAYALGGAK